MNISLSERPGVYSGYSTSGIITASSSSGDVGLIAPTPSITEPKRYVTTAAARADFPDDEYGYNARLLLGLEAALAGGAGACWVSPVLGNVGSNGSIAVTTDDYAAAAKALRDKDVYVIFSTSTDIQAMYVLRDEVVAASNARRERIFVAALSGEISTLINCAGMLSSERCVMVGPVPVGADGEDISAVAVSGSVAGAIVSLPDPAVPLSGAVLGGLYGGGGMLEDAEVDALVQGGVTPIECVGGRIEIVRGITTRVKTDDVEDTTWRELSTIMIADDVMSTLRSTLKSRFARAKNLPSTREAVANQTTLLLEAKKSAGIIADYGAVSATASDTDPSRCDVGFEFAVAYGMNRIVVAAHILV